FPPRRRSQGSTTGGGAPGPAPSAGRAEARLGSQGPTATGGPGGWAVGKKSSSPAKHRCVLRRAPGGRMAGRTAGGGRTPTVPDRGGHPRPGGFRTAAPDGGPLGLAFVFLHSSGMCRSACCWPKRLPQCGHGTRSSISGAVALGGGRSRRSRPS
ncbi:unnamed protein product, partial [Prorocentrum cordatum]